MRLPNFKKSKWGLTLITAIVLVFGLMQVVGLVFNIPSIMVFAQGTTAEDCEVKSRLLMEAMAFVGVSSPEEAAKVWAEGLKARSAAMQYSVMSSELKEAYAAKLDKTAPNWVTGISSPWVSGYEIIGVSKTGSKFVVTMSVATATSTGPAQSYKAKLIIQPEGKFYRITGIEADAGLSPYTGM